MNRDRLQQLAMGLQGILCLFAKWPTRCKWVLELMVGATAQLDYVESLILPHCVEPLKIALAKH